MQNIKSSINGISNAQKKERTYLFLLILPFILFVFAFSYGPLFGWIYAFFSFKPGIPLDKSPFVGLLYFKILFTEGRMDLIRVMTNTLVLSFLGILCSPLPAIFAILLNEIRSRYFKKFIQTTTTLPNFISWILIYSLAFAMFSSEGVLNSTLIKLGIIKESLSILDNIDIVWPFQTFLVLWKTIGWNAIIYIAAITGIDAELYDAAKVDGAGRFNTILHVTVPGIAPTFVVLLLLQISSLLSAGGSLDQFLMFYNSLVGDKLEVLDYYVYRIGILSQDYSYGTAIGIMKSIFSIMLLFSVNQISKRVRGNSII